MRLCLKPGFTVSILGGSSKFEENTADVGLDVEGTYG